ncbi:MAG: recombinase family protein [Candidatus Thermoplasmatota archaeon]|nr:recombinase family protein [Candidatus Thermoplasmatota archaeon]
MTKVAIYTRVSTEDQAKEGFSLDAQLTSLRKYCEAKGWEIVKEYVDDGHSGRNIKRPAYQQMMQEKDLWDMILVMKMDRIHRNSRNFMDMMDNLRKWNKEFTSMQESLDTSTAIGRFVVDIIQRIAQLESEQTGERVYTGMRQKAETVGGILGFNIPYGYDYKNGKLTINDNEARIVKKIFSDYLNGASMGKVVSDLNSSKIPTKFGKKWGKQTISTILKNPIYCGYMEWEDIIKRGTHLPIIAKESFNRVQEIMLMRTKKPGKKQKIHLK